MGPVSGLSDLQPLTYPWLLSANGGDDTSQKVIKMINENMTREAPPEVLQ